VTSDWKKIFLNPVKTQSILVGFMEHSTKVSAYKNKPE